MRPLPVEAFIPAVGQGIVGMECRSSDQETMEMLAGVSDPEAFACALAERAFPGAPGSELFHARGRLRPFGRA